MGFFGLNKHESGPDLMLVVKRFCVSCTFYSLGSDFIKTSTGKETVNATYPVAIVMVRAIRDYFLRTGYKVKVPLYLQIPLFYINHPAC